MLLIFPVAGRGTRFLPETEKTPKCILPIRDKLMIEWALASIYTENTKIVIITHEEQESDIEDALIDIIPHATFIRQKTPLEGAAHTVYQAHALIQNEKDIVVVDCDISAKSHYLNKGWEDFEGDGSVLTFYSQEPTKSYVSVKEGQVTEAVEKKVISDHAIGGIFHFRNGKYMLKAIEEVMNSGHKTKGEYYISTVLNSYINQGAKVIPFQAETFFDIGMPEGAKAFEGNLT